MDPIASKTGAESAGPVATNEDDRRVVPIAAILLPAGFFLSMTSPEAVQPNGFVVLIYAGAASLVAGVLTLGVGLLKSSIR
jgi:hypothetical protein